MRTIEQRARLEALQRGQWTRTSTVEDLLQEIELAKLEHKDPVDAVRYAYKYWEFGRKGHRRNKIERPVFMELLEHEWSRGGVEKEIADREFVNKLWLIVGTKARQAIACNLSGAPYVWRPEVKLELLLAATKLMEVR